MRLPIFATVLALSAGSAAVNVPAAAQSTPPFFVSELGRGFGTLQDAVSAIGEGEGTILIAPGRYADCAVQTAGRVAFVARQPGTVTFDGGVCEGKATLVLRGRGAHVEGVTFTHERVDDGNGAGIRLEQANLTVVASQFLDAQSGILTGDDTGATLSVDRSTFAGLGKHPNGNGAHGIYIGDYKLLKITNSRFERGTGGHYVKVRAARVEITDSSFDDTKGHDTNYMIDLSNGATGRIAGNTFVNGLGKENYTAFITVAPEGVKHPSAGLTIENNRAWLAPGYQWKTAFVGNWSGEAVVERNNELSAGLTPSRRLTDSGARQLLRMAYHFLQNKARGLLDA